MIYDFDYLYNFTWLIFPKFPRTSLAMGLQRQNAIKVDLDL